MGLGGESGGGMLGFLSGGNTPQAWNQGTQNAQFQPYSTGGGTTPGQDPYAGSRFQMGPFGQLYNEYGQNYTPYDNQGNSLTQAPLNNDFFSPGVGEQWQQQNQGRYLQPGAAGDYWNQVNGRYANGTPGVSNYSGQYFQNFQ